LFFKLLPRLKLENICEAGHIFCMDLDIKNKIELFYLYVIPLLAAGSSMVLLKRCPRLEVSFVRLSFFSVLLFWECSLVFVCTLYTFNIQSTNRWWVFFLLEPLILIHLFGKAWLVFYLGQCFSPPPPLFYFLFYFH